LVKNNNIVARNKINLIGFSQGAVVCLSLALEFPNVFNKIALLSGLLPDNLPSTLSTSIENLKFYIAHGTQDKIVEFNNAERMNAYLLGFGAQTIFCQEDIGHKIGAKCVLNLKRFFQNSAGLKK
jgi:phospholipase/carboxylesterase